MRREDGRCQTRSVYYGYSDDIDFQGDLILSYRGDVGVGRGGYQNEGNGRLRRL